MTDFTTQFLKRLKGVSLSQNERLAMRERLAMYADMHPAFDGATSGNNFFVFFASRRFSAYAGALMAFIVISSGVTFAAEGSVPGDTLYPLKVNVNETVMTAFSPTATGQAKVAAEIATRRADEAVVLASRGRLTNEHQEYLAKEFESSVKVATQKTEELEQAGKNIEAATVKAVLAASIAGEAQAFGAVQDEANDEHREFLRVLVAVNETIEGDDVDAAVAVTIAAAANQQQDPAATTMMMKVADDPEVPEAPVAKSAAFTVSTGTPPTTARTGVTKFIRLRFASTTLPVRLNSQLNTGVILAPKADVAIPATPVTPETTLTGVGN